MVLKHEAFIEQGESDTIEFKKTTSNLKSAFETVCAFLNGQGGTVYIGVNDAGKIVGQQTSDKTYIEVANEIKKIEPEEKIHVTYENLNSRKKVIVIKVDRGDHAPYTYDGRPYQRHQCTTNRMSQHLYEKLLVERGQLNHSWEEAIATKHTLDDLDHEEIYKTIFEGIRENRIPASAQRENVREILERLNLLDGANIKRAAAVLFAKSSSVKYVQCMIKMARFKGKNKLGDFIDNQQISGNAFTLLEEADSFLRRHLPISSVFSSKQFKRIDKPALPVIAVREALINAFCHRDYSDTYTDISLAIFDDRIEIWNSGLLLKKLTIEDLKHKHSSVLRNKLIANTFYVRGMIEKWGSGTNKIVQLCLQDGLPEPKFEEHTGGIELILYFNHSISSSSELPREEFALSERQKNILSLLATGGEFTIQYIIGKLQTPPSQRTIQNDLKKLKDQGLITNVGVGRSVKWILLNN